MYTENISTYMALCVCVCVYVYVYVYVYVCVCVCVGGRVSPFTYVISASWHFQSRKHQMLIAVTDTRHVRWHSYDICDVFWQYK
jgi:hypothetical protein